MTFTKRHRNILLVALIAALAAGVAVWALTTPRGKAVAERLPLVSTGKDKKATTQRKVRPEYEFGAPANELAELSPMAAAMIEQNSENADTTTAVPGGNSPADGSQAIEARVKATREKYQELQRVYIQYRDTPTEALATRGKKLKEEVLTGVAGLMPIARRYNYRAGIDEAQEMRRETLAMSFK